MTELNTHLFTHYKDQQRAQDQQPHSKQEYYEAFCLYIDRMFNLFVLLEKNTNEYH